MKRITFIPKRTGRAKLEKTIRVIKAIYDRKREKGNIKERDTGREWGRGGQRKKEGLSVARDVLVLRHMESRSASWPLQCVRALEFEISRIGARSIHLRDNIFRSKYEYYIISTVDAVERGGREGVSLPSPLVEAPHYLPPLPRESL